MITKFLPFILAVFLNGLSVAHGTDRQSWGDNSPDEPHCGQLLTDQNWYPAKLENRLWLPGSAQIVTTWSLRIILSLTTGRIFPQTEPGLVRLSLVNFINETPSDPQLTDHPGVLQIRETLTRDLIAYSRAAIFLQYPELESIQWPSFLEFASDQRDKAIESWVASLEKTYGSNLPLVQVGERFAHIPGLFERITERLQEIWYCTQGKMGEFCGL